MPTFTVVILWLRGMPLFQHILIVEAGAPLQTGLCRLFARWGFVHVTAVATGAEALQQAAAHPPDLVLLSASVTDGPEGPGLAHRLQAHHGPVPVLILVPETWQLYPPPCYLAGRRSVLVPAQTSYAGTTAAPS